MIFKKDPKYQILFGLYLYAGYGSDVQSYDQFINSMKTNMETFKSAHIKARFISDFASGCFETFIFNKISPISPSTPNYNNAMLYDVKL